MKYFTYRKYLVSFSISSTHIFKVNRAVQQMDPCCSKYSIGFAMKKKTKQCNEFVEVEINDAANERTFRTKIILCNNYFRLTSTIANSSEDEKVLSIGDFGRELFLSSPRLQRENTEVKSLVLDKVWQINKCPFKACFGGQSLSVFTVRSLRHCAGREAKRSGNVLSNIPAFDLSVALVFHSYFCVRTDVCLIFFAAGTLQGFLFYQQRSPRFGMKFVILSLGYLYEKF